MKFIELFAGIGGFRLGLERTGHECIWTNEFEQIPRGIYEYNFKEKPDERDIRTIPARDVPDADLIVGGFPCATFSLAGKRTGFSLEDTRGTLCFEMFRIAHEKQIPYIMFENVKGLLSHDSGKTFAVILTVLDELGYDCQWDLLDSQSFGIPQHRERIFVIGHLRGQPRPKIFPLGETSESPRTEIRNKRTGEQIIRGENKNDTTERDREYVVKMFEFGTLREYKSRGFPTLLASMGTGSENIPLLFPRDRSVKEKLLSQTSFSSLLMNEGSLNKNIDGSLRTRSNVREITPLECERLQGLPDDWTKHRIVDGKIELTRQKDRYERCGRTVTIPVIEAIGKKLGRSWYDKPKDSISETNKSSGENNRKQ